MEVYILVLFVNKQDLNSHMRPATSTEAQHPS